MKNPMERILVPLDGSPLADAAVEAIGPLLRIHQPEVLLLGVMDKMEYDYSLRAHLEVVRDDLQANGIDASMSIREGDAAENILEVARKRAADLIAMSTHGRGGMARAFLGSVTEEVLRHSETPLLVCRAGVKARGWKRVVVALDGSEQAEEILSDAVHIVQAEKAELDVVRVAVPVVSSSGMGEAPVIVHAEDPLPYLKRISGQLLAQGVEAQTVALEGRAAPEILRYAKESDAGLLCVTTHGRSGVSRVLLGSIAEELLRHAPCPVLIRRMVESPKPAGMP
jgi:nucleotide-binding universal stress UspA family protein